MSQVGQTTYCKMITIKTKISPKISVLVLRTQVSYKEFNVVCLF